MSQIMIQDARWQMPQITLSSFSLSRFLSLVHLPALLFTPHKLSLLLFCSLPSLPIPTPFSSKFEPVSFVYPRTSLSRSFLPVSPSVPSPPATVANLITHRFTGGRGEVNRGDKEGIDRSSEEGRWWGCSREIDGPM